MQASSILKVIVFSGNISVEPSNRRHVGLVGWVKVPTPSPLSVAYSTPPDEVENYIIMASVGRYV